MLYLGVKKDFANLAYMQHSDANQKRLIAFFISFSFIFILIIGVVIFFMKKGKICCFKRKSSLIFFNNQFLGTTKDRQQATQILTSMFTN
jgi:hypothetical protein